MPTGSRTGVEESIQPSPNNSRDDPECAKLLGGGDGSGSLMSGVGSDGPMPMRLKAESGSPM